MPVRLCILTLLGVLSMAPRAMAEPAQVRRCMAMTPDQNAAQVMGYGLRRIKTREIDIDDRPVVVQPVMAGMRGPALTLPGRDVRLAVTKDQSSPQELWQHAQWNVDPITDCPPLTRWNWLTRLKRDTVWNIRFDVLAGLTDTTPSILYRTRVVPGITFARPRGFMLGVAVATAPAGNTSALAALPDTRKPVRRDIARFSRTNALTLERLFASWHTTPVTDVHVGVSAGYLEEMYGGVGGEIIWRPFASPFWAGADAWHVWRRDPESDMNATWTDEQHFTGHVRAGYDMPFSRTTLSVAAGQYLAGDHGATITLAQSVDDTLRLSADLTWTNRREDQGFIDDTHFDGMVRAVWSLSKRAGANVDTRFTMRQVGRDGGQMMERPQPIEDFTEPLSGREIVRNWPRLLDK